MSKAPRYASEVPFVPVNWGDRDAIVGKLMGILEAVMSEGKQLEATKGLVKNCLSEHFGGMFNTQYEILTSEDFTEPVTDYASIVPYYKAIWETAQKYMPGQETIEGLKPTK